MTPRRQPTSYTRPRRQPLVNSETGLVIEPGRYRVRGGGVAIVVRRLDIIYQIKGGRKVYTVWTGTDEETATPLSWNRNGTFSPIVKHPTDLMERMP